MRQLHSAEIQRLIAEAKMQKCHVLVSSFLIADLADDNVDVCGKNFGQGNRMIN